MSATDNKALDYVIFRMLAKIIDTLSQVVIIECRKAFNLPLMTDIIKNKKLIVRYFTSDKLVCLHQKAEREIKALHLN